MRSSLGPALSATLALLAATSTGLANGRFPRAQRLLEHPDDPARLVLTGTYGMFVTRDRGLTWYHVCEPSFAHVAVYGGDPLVEFAGDRSMVAAILSGINVSTDEGCNWVPTLSDGNLSVVDDAVARSNPSTMVVAIVTIDAGLPKISLEISLDDAKTWQPVGNPLPLTNLYTFDIDPLDPAHFYATGMKDGVAQILTSPDLGTTWSGRPIPNTGADEIPYIAGIHPREPKRIFVRTDSSRQTNNLPEGDALLYTDDGGDTWRELFRSRAKMLGFALSPDGSQVLVGYSDPALTGPENTPGPLGVFESSTDVFAFERVYGGQVNCLAWTKTGVYVCSDESRDGFELAFSPVPDFRVDGGCLVPLLHFDEVSGPLACDPMTSGAACVTDWPVSCARFGACTPHPPKPRGCVPFDPHALDGGADGGAMGGGGGAMSDDAGAGGAGGSTDASDEPDGSIGEAGSPSARNEGCGCRAPGRAGIATPLAWGNALWVAVAMLSRSRRNRIFSKSARKRSGNESK